MMYFYKPFEKCSNNEKILLIAIVLIMAGIVYAQNVYIPDANFKNYLLGNTGINTDGDDGISLSEAAAFTGTISHAGGEYDAFDDWIPDNPFSDLTGIAAFTNLTGLYIPHNNLASIDLSANTALTTLDCGYNGLISLGLSANAALTSVVCENNNLSALNLNANTALTSLHCKGNGLTTLDLSMNTALTDLECGGNDLVALSLSTNTALGSLSCYGNQLSALDLSTNTALTYLHCADNNITSLDLSANLALTLLWCFDNQLNVLDIKNGNSSNIQYFMANGNPDLTCILVDDAAYATAVWWNLVDAQAYFSEDCQIPVEEITVAIATQNNVPAEITVNNGTLQLTSTVIPATFSPGVVWSIVPVTGSANISAADYFVDAGGLVTATQNGTVYAKAVSVVNPDKSDSLLITISNQGAGVQDITSQDRFSIYPNPNKGRFVLEGPATGLGSDTLVITGMSGQQAYTQTTTVTGNRLHMKIGAEGLTPGVYYLSLFRDGARIVIKKFTKM